MAFANIARRTQWIGAALLFVASILFLITTISAPIWSSVGLLKVHLNNSTASHNSTISFGTFGYCTLRAGPLENAADSCSRRTIGYEPAHIIADVDHTTLSDIASGTSDGLTRMMILHPVITTVTFAAWLASLGAKLFGSLLSLVLAAISLVLCVIVIGIDFSLFGILRHHINGDGSGSHAEFGSGIWCLLAGFVLLLWGMVMVGFTCLSTRREKNRGMPKTEVAGNAPVPGPPLGKRKKRFGVF